MRWCLTKIPDRELNPGRLGESQESKPLDHIGWDEIGKKAIWWTNAFEWNERRWDEMFVEFWIASAKSFFMRGQYTQNANVCNPITFTSDQKHCPSSQISTFQIVTSLFTSHTKMKANAIFRLKPSSLKSAYNRNFVKTDIAAMLAMVSLKSVYFATD